MTVVGPDLALARFVRRSEVHGVGGSQEEVLGSGNDRDACPPKQALVYGDEAPRDIVYVRRKAQGQIARAGSGRPAFPHTPMQRRMKLGKSPKRRIDRIRFPDKLQNARGLGFVEIEFCDAGLLLFISLQDRGGARYPQRRQAKPTSIHLVLLRNSGILLKR